MSKDTGGSAFPGLNAEMTGIDSDGQERFDVEPSGGMTLRDYFAAKAPAATDSWVATQAGIDRSKNPYNDDYKPRLRSDIEIRATYAYQWADAMIAERAK